MSFSSSHLASAVRASDVSSRVPKFLSRLHAIVSNPAYYWVLHWSDDGSYVVIEDISAFQDNIMPFLTRSANIAAFHRQLSNYGFSRHIISPAKMHFASHFFIRGRSDLLDKFVDWKEEQSSKPKRHLKISSSSAAPSDSQLLEIQALRDKIKALEEQNRELMEINRRLQALSSDSSLPSLPIWTEPETPSEFLWNSPVVPSVDVLSMHFPPPRFDRTPSITAAEGSSKHEYEPVVWIP
jgi:hypothetical protein